MMRYSMFILPLLAALAASSAARAEDRLPPSSVDYAGFQALVVELAEIRDTRLLAREEFFARARSDDALILDTRSAEAFAAGHVEGAVNLPFSDFTQDKLLAVIGPDRDRPIFIYCNNNFTEDAFPVRLKRAPLALNIPTFVNLFGYGYTNVWELEGTMTTDEVPWVRAPVLQD
ncbi:rhodanese-like domain-containing protein [Qipengyuania nanhaisediminis]|uniref:rhodanese-like domain-containing protein n=1 Tax=Qipengyuania nanhaisediminis TaxID=604088 RepID=UPI0038B2BF15